MASNLAPLLFYMGAQFSEFFTRMGNVAENYMANGNLPQTLPAATNGIMAHGPQAQTLPSNGLADTTKEKKRRGRKANPDKPKRSLTAFNMFVRAKIKEQKEAEAASGAVAVADEHRGIDLMKRAVEQWNELSQEEKLKLKTDLLRDNLLRETDEVAATPPHSPVFPPEAADEGEAAEEAPATGDKKKKKKKKRRASELEGGAVQEGNGAEAAEAEEAARQEEPSLVEEKKKKKKKKHKKHGEEGVE